MGKEDDELVACAPFVVALWKCDDVFDFWFLMAALQEHATYKQHITSSSTDHACLPSSDLVRVANPQFGHPADESLDPMGLYTLHYSDVGGTHTCFTTRSAGRFPAGNVSIGTSMRASPKKRRRCSASQRSAAPRRTANAFSFPSLLFYR